METLAVRLFSNRVGSQKFDSKRRRMMSRFGPKSLSFLFMNMPCCVLYIWDPLSMSSGSAIRQNTFYPSVVL